MAVNLELISEKIYNLLIGNGYEVTTFNEDGEIAIDPSTATRFVVNEPNMLVRLDKAIETISFAVNEKASVDDLRGNLKELANDFLMNFDYRIFGKQLKPKSEQIDVAKNTTESKMADITEGFGPMTGSAKTSYQPLDNVKLVVRHKKHVDEEIRGARSRNISSLFIQRGDERFKLPETNHKAARAMMRHVKNGGEVFDSIGNAINEMAKQQSSLREFVRYVRKAKLVNETNEEYVSLAIENIEHISRTFQKLSGVKTYASAVEEVDKFSNVEVLQDDLDLESKFTETHFDDRVANVIDTIKSAMSRKSAFEHAIDEAVKLETFANLKNLLSEGEGLEFASPGAKLGHQVSQMSSIANDNRLGAYLSGISKKLHSGGNLSQHEYTTVKSCLLGAHGMNNNNNSVAEDVERNYEKFIESFVIL